jgi:hypothetical protein
MRKFSIIKSEKTLKDQLLQELMGCYMEIFHITTLIGALCGNFPYKFCKKAEAKPLFPFLAVYMEKVDLNTS